MDGFCTYRFTENGSRFTCFTVVFCTSRWTMDQAKRWTMDGFFTRTTYNVQPTTFSDSLNQSMNGFCTYRFTENGSRFTCFTVVFCTSRWTKLAVRQALDETSVMDDGRFFTRTTHNVQRFLKRTT
jgi:hypothetical protein